MNPLCECGCGKEVTSERNKFISGHNSKGKKRSLESIWKQKQTCLTLFGGFSAMCSKAIQEKSKQSWKNKNVKEMLEKENKKKQTNIKLYGVEHPLQSKEIQEKVKQTNLRKTGFNNPFKNPEIKEKIRLKNQQMLNVDYPMQSKEIQKKSQNTCFIKYDKRNISQVEKIKEKKKLSYNDHYGADHWSQSQYGKLIHRINAIKRTEIQKLNGEPLFPCIGIIERSFLNELQKYITFNIIRQDESFKYVVGRYPDGHIPELKLFIQFNEEEHFLDKETMKIENKNTLQTTLDLASLGYFVFNVSEIDWTYNKEKVIEQFQKLLKEINNYVNT